MFAQGPQGLRGPSSATAGSSIEVEVQDGATTIEVGVIGDPATSRYDVGPDGRVTIPVPSEAAGSFLVIGTVGPPPPNAITIPIVSTD